MPDSSYIHRMLRTIHIDANATGNVSVQVTERSCKLQLPSRAHGLEVILVYKSL